MIKKMSMINELHNDDLSKIIKSSQINIQKETLQTLDERIKSII